jgi:hypothetical protein
MGWMVTPLPNRSTPGKETRYPLYRRLEGPQGRSERVWKISPPPGFDPRTVHLIANSYTGYAIHPDRQTYKQSKFNSNSILVRLRTQTLFHDVLLCTSFKSCTSLKFWTLGTRRLHSFQRCGQSI